jgi:hypothetical protein
MLLVPVTVFEIFPNLAESGPLKLDEEHAYWDIQLPEREGGFLKVHQ